MSIPETLSPLRTTIVGISGMSVLRDSQAHLAHAALPGA